MFDPASGSKPAHRRTAAPSNDDLPGHGGTTTPVTRTAELALIRARLIALEALVISILSGASDEDVDFAGDMAAYISPRPGSTRHPLALSAADRMGGLIRRSKHMRLERPV